MEEREGLEQLRQSLGMIKSLLTAKNDSRQQSNVEAARQTAEFVCFYAQTLYKECLECINYMEETFFSDSKKVNLSKKDIYKEVNDLQKDAKNWFVSEQKIWLENKTAIAFIGGFSSGKTTIVNRMLGEEHKMPVDIRATTAVATYVSYSSIGMVKFADFEHTVKYLDDNDILKKFTKFNDTLNDFPTSKLVRNFIVEDDNPTLQKLQNISILDTPGFENDDEDTKRVMDVIEETDAIFWVIDINKGDINNYSLQVIKKHIGKIPLKIVINKTDLKSPNEREAVRQKIFDTLEKNNVNIVEKDIILFSKNMEIEKITSVMQNIERKRKNRAEFFADIEEEFSDILEMLQRYITHFNKKLRENKQETRDIKNNISEKERDAESLLKSVETMRDELMRFSQINSLFRVCYREKFNNIHQRWIDDKKKRTKTLSQISDLWEKLVSLSNKENAIYNTIKNLESLVSRCNSERKIFKELIEPFTDAN
jgi:predicted GTPase